MHSAKLKHRTVQLETGQTMNATELELQHDMLEKDLDFLRGELGPKFKKIDPRDKDKKLKMLGTLTENTSLFV